MRTMVKGRNGGEKVSTMIDRWRNSDHEDSDVREGLLIAADEFVDACTPREPNPKWFGTGKGQWDSWWVFFTPEYRLRPTVFYECSAQDGVLFAKSFGCDLRDVKACVPVAREGFPSPRGWKGIAE